MEKKDIRSQIIISQNLNCAICHKPLLNFNKLINFSNFGQNIISIDNINDNNIFKTELRNSLIIKYISKSWQQNIEIDDMIPKTLMKDSGLQILEANLNKTALHRNCHKLKRKIDEKYV